MRPIFISQVRFATLARESRGEKSAAGGSALVARHRLEVQAGTESCSLHSAESRQAEFEHGMRDARLSGIFTLRVDAQDDAQQQQRMHIHVATTESIMTIDSAAAQPDAHRSRARVALRTHVLCAPTVGVCAHVRARARLLHVCCALLQPFCQNLIILPELDTNLRRACSGKTHTCALQCNAVGLACLNRFPMHQSSRLVVWYLQSGSSEC